MKEFPYLIFTLLFQVFIFNHCVIAQEYGIGLEIDEFTGDTILSSDWITLNDPVWKKGRIAYLKISTIDKQLVLQFKTTTGNNIAFVDEGDLFYIKLANNQILEFSSMTSEFTTLGGGAINLRGSKTEGFFLHFLITEKQLVDLAKSNIYKVRLNTQQGYLEIEPEKKKYAEVLRDYFETYLRHSQ